MSHGNLRAMSTEDVVTWAKLSWDHCVAHPEMWYTGTGKKAQPAAAVTGLQWLINELYRRNQEGTWSPRPTPQLQSW